MGAQDEKRKALVVPPDVRPALAGETSAGAGKMVEGRKPQSAFGGRYRQSFPIHSTP